MSRNPDVLVIGGGIVGAACAYALSSSGAAIRVIERNFAASGTSRACDGLVLCFDKLSDAELAMARDSAALWAELNASLGADFHYRRAGSIVASDTAEGLSVVAQKAAKLQGAGIRAEVLGGKELVALEPCLAPDLAGGVFYPDDAQLDARLATVALMQAARRQGAQWQEGQQAVALRRAAGGRSLEATILSADGSERVVSAGAVVLAAGVWSAQIALTLGLTLPIKPRKGHILVSSPMPGLLRHPLIEGSYAASVAAAGRGGVEVALVAEMTAGDTMLLGSSREFAGFDTSISAHVAQAIAARAQRYLPRLAQASVIRSYAGLRPWSPDHLPLIGPVSAAPGLYLATGHEGAGIGLAPVTGRLIARWVTGETLPAYAQAVRPDRFDLVN
jgi:D-hydroxyproline dehydrogenase subunit beta